MHRLDLAVCMYSVTRRLSSSKKLPQISLDLRKRSFFLLVEYVAVYVARLMEGRQRETI
jgi:hypothetical protein